MAYNRIDSLLGTTGKLTPQAVEFEEAVLGALMIDDNAVTEVLSVLKPEMFYVEANQHVFSAIQRLFSASQPIDVLTVTNQLKKDKTLELSGGASYVAGLTNRLNSSANLEFHARIVMEKFILRDWRCSTAPNRRFSPSWRTTSSATARSWAMW